MSLQVALERARVRKAKTTHRANKRLLAGVSAHVRAQVSGDGEGAVAERTSPGLVAEVNGALVPSQAGRAVETHRALATHERSLAAVRPRVHLQSTERAERPRTVGAAVRTGSGVNARVDRQQRRVLEASSAVGADVRRRVRVRTFVVGTRAVLSEALLAAVDAADVRPFSRVGPHVRCQRRRRPELPSTVAAHARPLVAQRCCGARSRGGSGSAVSRSVQPTLVHCQERRQSELSAAYGTDVIPRRRTTSVARLATFAPVRSLVSHQQTGVLKPLAANTARPRRSVCPVPLYQLPMTSL